MIVVYVTCSDLAEAKKIGRHLFAKRLCTCINIFPQKVHPMYWWPPKANKIDETPETVMLIKTIERKYKEVEKEVCRVHSSDTPCIFALPVVHVYKPYFDWLKGEIELGEEKRTGK